MTNIFQNPKVILIAVLAFIVLAVVAVVPHNEINIQSSSSSATGTITFEQDDTLLAANATILEVVSGHAWQGHGTEVNDAIRCLNNHGSTKSFQTFGFFDSNGKPIKTNMWLCQEGDDWYVIVTTTLEKFGGNRIGRLITAYLIDKSKFLVIQDFIDLAIVKWGARVISFAIEAGSVFIQPK